MNDIIRWEEFFNAYKECLGVDGAEELLKNAATKAGLKQKTLYSKEEALIICDTLRLHGGFVKIIAEILKARFILR